MSGTPEAHGLVTRKPTGEAGWPKPCTVEGCDRALLARGLCGLHYKRMRRTGTTDAPVHSRGERLWSKVDRSDDLGCWLWLGHRGADGYGRMVSSSGTALVHRIAYELVKGPIPRGLVLDHLCRVRHCVNPEHLEPVTIAENVRRGEGESHRLHRLGRCRNGHDLSVHAVRKADGKVAYCRICRNAKRRAGASC